MRKLTTALLPVALLATSFATHAATSDGKTFSVTAGWLHIMPQGEKQGVTGDITSKTVQGALKTNSVYAGDAGFEIDDADTGGLLFDYYVNDNVVLELVAGVPPKMEIDGKGIILKEAGGVNLGSVGKVGEVDAYTPVVLGKYQFGTVDSKFRPYVGAGIMYAHFSDFKLEGGVNEKIANSNAVTKLIQPEVRNVEIKDAVAPVVTVGADYNFNKDWFATASVTYAQLDTKATLDLYSNTLKETALKGSTKIEINPIVTYVGIGYRF
ncbi:OmpW/AlkL family protein [Acinetobacter ursingii]|uniref:OmpW/AlkL family protein n=1 Tax=Acinetobacter ursingii TaxID=108980 RepID=UPI00125030DB|nr:OmpW family outer membrane protein [Acinetobacter ursingii]